MISHPATIGVILAGGCASRMGGGDKGLLVVGRSSILQRVADTLLSQCSLVLLNANGDPSRFADIGLPVVSDGRTDQPGPLAGILAGLDWMAREQPAIEWLASVACDTPFLPGDLVVRLHRARAEAGAVLAMAGSGGRRHPVIGLWPVSLRMALRAALDQGERRVGHWAADQGAAVASWDTKGRDPFLNVNEPADLEQAREQAMR